MIGYTLWLAQTTEKAFIQLRGKGSYKNAYLLKETTQILLNQGVTNLTIDFEKCMGMDSTFLGILAGLALESRQLNGELSLINLQSRNFELIQNMGMDHLVRVNQENQFSQPSLTFQPLKEKEETKSQATKTMIEAHEALIKIHEGNRSHFQNVIECLQESVQKQTHSKKSRIGLLK